MSTHALSIVRTLDAPVDLVYEAWTSAEHAQRWWFPRQKGRDFQCTSFAMDFRVGGAYRYCIRSPDGEETWAHGVYREIVPAKRLVFTFQWEWAPRPSPDTVITVRFEALAGDQTRLTFEQAPFESEAMRDGHTLGWGAVLDHLAAELARRHEAAS
ncbi:MAG TPA: SRPBCC domain-containing protein [Burkholderiaceae bacterium]|jgi:uncharacterized protein YndB with AHSA1/START domain